MNLEFEKYSQILLDFSQSCRTLCESYSRFKTGAKSGTLFARPRGRAHVRLRYAAAPRAARIPCAELRKELHGGGVVRRSLPRAAARAHSRPQHALPARFQARIGRRRQAFLGRSGAHVSLSARRLRRAQRTPALKMHAVRMPHPYGLRALQAHFRRGARQQRILARSKGNRALRRLQDCREQSPGETTEAEEK